MTGSRPPVADLPADKAAPQHPWPCFRTLHAFEAIAASFRNKYGVERSVVFSMTPDVAVRAVPGTELAMRDADVPRQRGADEG